MRDHYDEHHGACTRCGKGGPGYYCANLDCSHCPAYVPPSWPIPHPTQSTLVMGCICPPTSEQTCMNPVCPRKPIGKASDVS
jgi:hypothetical protein